MPGNGKEARGAVAAGQALAPASKDKPQSRTEEAGFEEARWRPVLGLPCQLTVDLPLPDLKVADFLKLKAGSVISTGWRLNRDVPLRVNGTLIAWGEFEGARGRLSVRVTEVA